jgi:hypothetical protein
MEQSKERIRRAASLWHWDEAWEELRAGNFASSLVDDFLTACEERDVYSDILNVYSYFLDDAFLSHCNRQQLDRVISIAIERQRWDMVGKMLKGCSVTKQMWTVLKAIKTANERDFVDYILPQCSCQQLKRALTHLVSRGLWEPVGLVLERGVSDTQHAWAVEKASKTAGEEDFIDYILTHCTSDRLVSVLPHLVSRAMWKSVGLVLKKGVNNTQHRWAVEEASRRAKDCDFATYILPNNTGVQLEITLPNLVSRHLWTSVGLVLKRGVSDTEHRWVVEEASKRAKDWEFIHQILPYSTGVQLEIALPNLVSRRMCQSVGLVLEKGVSDTQHRWAVEEASKTAKSWDITIVERDFIDYILPHCTGTQLEPALPHFVSRDMWKSVGLVLREVSVTHNTGGQWRKPARELKTGTLPVTYFLTVQAFN